MAVKDRISFEDLDMVHPQARLEDVPNSGFVPSLEDQYSMREDMIHATVLVLIKFFPAFHIFDGLFPKYFKNKYSQQMNKKSVVVNYNKWFVFIIYYCNNRNFC